MATVQDTINSLRMALTAIYPEQEATAIARQVLEHVLQKSRLALSLEREAEVNPSDSEKIEQILQRLLRHEPLQYVLGVAHFYGLELLVDERVLIPRPETEELVDLVVKEHRARQSLQVLDICAGSGCIPLALAANLATSNVYGLELSEGALQVARANAAKYNLPVEWLHQDVFEAIQKIAPHSLDIITSNPPYVLEREKQDMRANVLQFEPHLALFVPNEEALKYYKRIADVAAELLKKGGKLYFEINEKYGIGVKELLQKAGFSEIDVLKDLFGKDRIVRAVL